MDENDIGNSADSHETGTASPAVDVRNTTKIFGDGNDSVTALDDVSVAIEQNEFFTLLGPSGCGKTTLLRLIAGFEHPTRGSILLNGADISALPPYKRPVNTVFQNYALFPHMTVAKNIAFGLQMLNWPREKVRETVERMLKLVRMETLSARRTSQISGGQQQRVALARALAPSPQVLLLDEPLSALDLKLRKDMQIELKRLQHETGITFVFVTHDQEEALTMSDRIAVMNEGKILQVGAPREIYDHPANRFVANFIGETNFLQADVLSLRARTAVLQLSRDVKVQAVMPRDMAARKIVSVVVRPEHASLTAPAKGAGVLAGTLENTVYFGTDTHFHVALRDGGKFIVRMQNTPDAAEHFKPGAPVGIRLGKDAVQVLRD